MTSTITKKRLIIGVIALIAAIIWCVLVIRINILHPPIPRETYYLNETYTVRGVEVTMTQFRTVAGDEAKAILQETDPNWYGEIIENYSDERFRLALVTVHVKNTGDTAYESAFGSVANGYMITPVDSLSYMDMDIAQMLNTKAYGDDWMALDIGEEKVWTLTYFLDQTWVSAKWWAQVDAIPYEFIIDDYPVEIRLSTVPRPQS